MFKFSTVILGVSYFVLASSESLAPFIKPCGQTDSVCIVESAKGALKYFAEGVASLGMKPLDPLYLKDVKADSGEMKLAFKNLVFTRAGQTKIVKITRDPAKNTGQIVADIPVDLKGDYVMNGKLLLVEVFGEGKTHIYGDQLRVTVDFRLKDIEKGGNKHYKIAGFDYKYEPLTKFHLEFLNLYNGDETKAEPIKKILDENSKEVLDIFGKNVIASVLKEIVTVIDQFFSAVPANQLEIV